MRWTLLIDEAGQPGHENMAIDVALLRAAREGDVGFLRLYRWDPPCLSFGRNEPARDRYDAEAIRRLGLDTVRRPTGGRAVWHDAELTYAVAAPCTTFGSLRTTYRTIHETLVAALQGLGVAAAIAPDRRERHVRPGAGACFAIPAGGEVIVGARKLVGSAQVREGNAFLQHGSLLLDGGQDVVAQVTRGAPPALAATSLREVIGREVTFGEVARAVAATARERWRGGWTSTAVSPSVAGITMFGDRHWTWRA